MSNNKVVVHVLPASERSVYRVAEVVIRSGTQRFYLTRLELLRLHESALAAVKAIGSAT